MPATETMHGFIAHFTFFAHQLANEITMNVRYWHYLQEKMVMTRVWQVNVAHAGQAASAQR